MLRFALAAVVSLLLGSGVFAQEDVLAEGRARSQAFFADRFDDLWRDMTSEMQAAFGTIEALESFRDRLANDFGRETGPVEEKALRQQGHDIYLRTSRWTRSDAPVRMQWTFDGERRIAGFFVKHVPQAASSRFLDYRTKASLRLPFEGEWFVFWGGRTIEQNYHASDKAQRFALDFLIRRKGTTHSGNADRLESYFCWDKPVLSPAETTVAAMADGLPDQPIGQTDPHNAAGNHVVLDLGGGEYAFLAHLKRGSVAVRVGDRVASGQELGRCGNSGNTSEPHLHFHLQTTPVLHQGEGLPAFFENYRADGKPVASGEPVMGQTVSSE